MKQLGMKRLALLLANIGALLLASWGLLQWASAWSQANAAVSLQATGPALHSDVPRIGLNLGGASTWGAEQLLSNIVHNPGFEATLDRTLIIVADVAGNKVQDDSPWLARANGFWRGAHFYVLTGRAAGKQGQVLDSYQTGATKASWLILEPLPPAISNGDAIALSHTQENMDVPLWWRGSGDISAIKQTRPGNQGQQAVRLQAHAQGAALHHYFDMLGARAGILLPVRGAWRLQFWARGVNGGQAATMLKLRFARSDAAPFLQQQVPLSDAWQEYAFVFEGNEVESANSVGNLTLSFEIEQGSVLLDDVVLGPMQEKNATLASAFRPEVRALLRQLRPGYLRDWQGQLGDSFANRMAEPSARQPVRYRPGKDESHYFYSLPEFFALCAEVGAQPWVVAPPLMMDAEWQQFGALLAKAKAEYGFQQIMLEFGNENWNMLFRPAGLTDARSHALAASRAFAQLALGAQNDSLSHVTLVVNAQFVNPASWEHMAKSFPTAQRIAVAPYFLYQLPKLDGTDAQADKAQAIQAAFSDGFAANERLLQRGATALAASDKRLAVYEINFHTTEQHAADVSSSSALRNAVVSEAHAGPALARRLMQTMQAGVREQAVYSLAGFDSYTSKDRELVRLWGIARDLRGSALRPTGLALSLLNQAIGEHSAVFASNCLEKHLLQQHCAQISALWFQAQKTKRLVVVSSSAQATRIHTGLPCHRQFALTLLDGSQPGRHNEDPNAAQVQLEKRVAQCRQEWQFTLPAYSMALLQESSPAQKNQEKQP